MMNLPFLLELITGYIDVNSLSAMFFYKNANSSRMTVFAENPLAASDEDANARIEDRFENVISPLLSTKHAGFNQ